MCRRVRGLAARVAAVIRIDALWLAASPVDMRAGPERLLARVVQHGDLFYRDFQLCRHVISS